MSTQKKIKMSREDFAKLANHLVQCSGVTFNKEADDRKQFQDFKMFCGRVSAYIGRKAESWNAELMDTLMLTDEDQIELQEFDEKMQAIEGNKKERKKARKELKGEYKDVLEKEKELATKIKAYGEEVVELELETYPKYETPMNINGAFLDTIVKVLEG